MEKYFYENIGNFRKIQTKSFEKFYEILKKILSKKYKKLNRILHITYGNLG